MMRLRQLHADENGIALVMALGTMVVLTILIVSMLGYTSANTQSARLSSDRLQAQSYATAGVSTAVSILANAIATSGNPAAANLLGCAGATGASDTHGPSNCTTPTPIVFCLSGGTCTAKSDHTASIYGYFSGTNGGSYAGYTVPASTWLIVSTGYAFAPSNGGTSGQSTYAEIKVQGLNSGNVAAVWNHVFITSPLVAGQCSLDFSGNNISVNVPLYVVGNMCLGGSTITESTQPVDVMVGGYLYINGGGVGSTTAPVTSGVVQGGCSSSINGSGATPCTNGSWNYHVKSNETFISQEAPAETTADIQNDYSTFDPGPAHPCATGNNPYAPLASTTFDTNSVYDGGAGTFTLTPGSSYTCNSTSGASTGQLQWDNTAKKLTVNGSIFIDGNLTISQSLTYTGTGVIEVAGTILFSGNNIAVCAVANCTQSNWQGTSGNNQMLSLVSLASNTIGIKFADNAQFYQGSLWTQPTSTLTFIKNGDQIQGPMAIGKLDSTFNNATLNPLPVIKNMPVGAPIPPNTGATLGTLSFVG